MKADIPFRDGSGSMPGVSMGSVLDQLYSGSQSSGQTETKIVVSCKATMLLMC